MYLILHRGVLTSVYYKCIRGLHFKFKKILFIKTIKTVIQSEKETFKCFFLALHGVVRDITATYILSLPEDGADEYRFERCQ